MTQPISSLNNLPPLQLPGLPTAGAKQVEGKNSFKDLMVQAVAETNQLEMKAQNAIERSMLGEDIAQVEVLSAVKKADLSMRLLLQMRNKIMDAYQEVQQLRM